MDTTTTTTTTMMLKPSPLIRKRKKSVPPPSVDNSNNNSSSTDRRHRFSDALNNGGDGGRRRNDDNNNRPSKRARHDHESNNNNRKSAITDKKEQREEDTQLSSSSSSSASFASSSLGDFQLDEELESRIYIEQAILQMEQQAATMKKPKNKKSSAASSSTSSRVIIEEGFQWTSYPMLEEFLCREARAFFKSQHQGAKSSSKSSIHHRAQQVEYNDSLTRQLRTIARRHGYIFGASMDDDRKLRHWVRSYYKSVVNAVIERHNSIVNETGKWDDNFRTIVMGLQQLQQQQQQQKGSKSKINNSSSSNNNNGSKKSGGILKRRGIQADVAAGQGLAIGHTGSVTGAQQPYEKKHPNNKPKDRNEALHRRLQVIFQSPPRKINTTVAAKPKNKLKAVNASSKPKTQPLGGKQLATSSSSDSTKLAAISSSQLGTAQTTLKDTPSSSSSSMGVLAGDTDSVVLTCPSVAVPRANERIYKLWTGVKQMDRITTTSYPTILSPQDAPIWQSLQTLQAVIHVHLASGLPELAVRLCHDELSRLYQEATNLLLKEAQSATSPTTLTLPVRDKLAATWCLYAQTLADLGAIYDSSSLDSNNSNKDKADSSNVGDEASCSTSELEHSWLDSAFSALSMAAGCRLVGNHSYITLALARLFLLHWSGYSHGRHETNDGVWLDSETQSLFPATLDTAFNICWDGIDRARARPFEPRQALNSESVNNQEHVENLKWLLSTVAVNKELNNGISSTALQPATLKNDQGPPQVKFQCTVDTLVASMARIVQAKSSLPSPSPGQQVHPTQFLFVDKTSIRSLCLELNHLSHISEVLASKSTTALKIRKADRPYASSSGIAMLSLFQPLDVIASDGV